MCSLAPKLDAVLEHCVSDKGPNLMRISLKFIFETLVLFSYVQM